MEPSTDKKPNGATSTPPPPQPKKIVVSSLLPNHNLHHNASMFMATDQPPPGYQPPASLKITDASTQCDRSPRPSLIGPYKTAATPTEREDFNILMPPISAGGYAVYYGATDRLHRNTPSMIALPSNSLTNCGPTAMLSPPATPGLTPLESGTFTFGGLPADAVVARFLAPLSLLSCFICFSVPAVVLAFLPPKSRWVNYKLSMVLSFLSMSLATVVGIVLVLYYFVYVPMLTMRQKSH